jgi:hypothetical protein
MEKELIDKIVYHHIHKIDKNYRMFAGLASILDDYIDATLYITIHKNSKWKKDYIVTAKQIAGDWRDFNDELKQAEKYHVTIIHNEAATGFVLNAEEFNNQSIISEIVDAIKNTPDISVIRNESGSIVVKGNIKPI